MLTTRELIDSRLKWKSSAQGCSERQRSFIAWYNEALERVKKRFAEEAAAFEKKHGSAR
jgi:hypothetical protein